MAALPRVRAFLNMSVQGLQPKSPWSWPSWKPSLLRLWGRYQSVPQQYLRHQETLSTMTLRLFEFCIKKKKEFFKKRLLLVTATRLASTSRRHTEANIKIHIIQDQKQRSQFPPIHTTKSPFQTLPAFSSWCGSQEGWEMEQVGLEGRIRKVRSLFLALSNLQTLLSFSGPLKKGVRPSLELPHWLRPYLLLSFSFFIK